MPSLRTEGRHRVVLVVLAAAWLGAGCSGAKHADSATPAAGQHDEGILLTPDPPTVRTQLAVTLDRSGLDPGRCTFVWQRNGSVISDAHGPELMPGQFQKGDEIAVEVTPPADASGKPLTARTTVADSPPVLMSTQLVPVGNGATLQAHPDGSDPDGDAVSYRYRWFRNDQPIAGATEDRIAMGGFQRSDRIAVEVVAVAARAESGPLKSEPFAFDNHPPQFSAAPTALSPGQSVLRYQAAATDPDGDALHWELAEAPAGMVVDATGAITWTPPTGTREAGDYTVKLRVTDGKGGEATQSFAIKVGPAAR
ncbi:MAG: putative Ig domain-containing protein [Candidatus Eisenbacteria bacterium]